MSTPAEQQGTEPTAAELWKSVAADREQAAPETPEQTQHVEPPKEPVQPTEQTTQAAVPEVTVDPYEGLSPAVKAKLEQLDTLAASMRTAHTHIGNLMQQNKSLVEQVAAAKQAIPAGTPTPTAAQVTEATKSFAKFEQLKKDFPELVDALEERFGAVAPAPDLDALRSQIQEQLEGEITTKLTAKVRDEIAAETEARLLNAAHRNWTETVKSKEFTEWTQKQAPEIQALGASPKAEDAMQMLDLFKAQQAVAAPRVDPAKVLADRQARLKEAAGLTRGTSAMEPVKSIDDMTPAEQWAFMAAERKRIAAQR